MRRFACNGLTAVLLFFAFLCPSGAVQAQVCSASAAPLNFGTISPINGSAVAATGAITVTCNWSTVSLGPVALVCLNLAMVRPLTLVAPSGPGTLAYDLYTDSAKSIPWGSATAGTTPISVVLSKPSLVGSSTSATVSYYGQITASQQTVPTVLNADTIYSHAAIGTEGAITYGYYLLGLIGPNSCSAPPPSTGTFGLAVNATVTNNCNITTTDINFTATGLLTTALKGTGTITAQCTSGDAYRISLSTGSSNTYASRTMNRTGGGAVSYQLYTDSQATKPWGDTTNGTFTVDGTGTGTAVPITVYGVVPIQTTPQAGQYVDTITATITF